MMVPSIPAVAVVTSDWHLDAVTAGVERYDEIAWSAALVVEHAIEANHHNPVVFVFAGDLTDPEPPRCWRAAKLAASLATDLDAAGVAQVWLTGNHDVLEDGQGSNTLQPLDCVRHDRRKVADTPTVWWPYPNLGVLCLPYVPRSHTYDPAQYVAQVAAHPRAPDIRLIVGHLMLEGIGKGSESDEFARGRDVFFPLAAVRKHFPGVQVVNGHYHAGQIYRDVVIPGSLARLTVAEASNTPRFLEIKL